MLIRLLKDPRAGGFILLITLFLLLWLKFFISPFQVDRIQGMPLYDLVFGPLETRRIASSIVSILFYGLLVFFVYRMNVIHFLLAERSIMPSAFFLLISATFPSALQINPILVSSIFLFLAIITLITGEEHRAEPLSLFNAALLLGIGSLFYFKILYYVPFLWITVAVIRPIHWRGIINPLLVLLMIGLFYFTWYWVFKDDLSLFADLLRENNIVGGKFPGFTTPVWILLGYIFILVVTASVRLISRFQVRKIIVRKTYEVFFFMFIYSLLFYILFSRYSPEIITILALPLSFLFSIIFNQRKNHWLHEVSLWIWVGLIGYVILSS